jgi:PAS domain-containing protein
VIADTDELDTWATEHGDLKDSTRERASHLTATDRPALNNHILQEIAQKESSSTVFAALVSFIEETLSCDFAEISLVDNRLRRLFRAAGSKVPNDLIATPVFSSLGAGYGACAAAVINREAVISVCIKSDPKWINVRRLAMKHGIRSCWAYPIIVNREVIGVIGAYFSTKKKPISDHLTFLELSSYIAGISLQMSGVGESIDHFEKCAAFIGVDREFRVRAINREASRILDRSAKEMVGQNLLELYPNIDPAVVAEYQKALTQNIMVVFENISSRLGLRLTVVVRPSNEGLVIFFREAGSKASAAVA